MNQTASPLLRLPRELRDKIFLSSIVIKKVFVLEILSQVPIPAMSNVGLLASCRQINHEVKIQIPDTHMLSRCCCPSCCRFNHEAESLVPDAPTLSLRLGENIYPHRFFRAACANRQLVPYLLFVVVELMVLGLCGFQFRGLKLLGSNYIMSAARGRVRHMSSLTTCSKSMVSVYVSIHYEVRE